MMDEKKLDELYDTLVAGEGDEGKEKEASIDFSELSTQLRKTAAEIKEGSTEDIEQYEQNGIKGSKAIDSDNLDKQQLKEIVMQGQEGNPNYQDAYKKLMELLEEEEEEKDNAEEVSNSKEEEIDMDSSEEIDKEAMIEELSDQLVKELM